jgi:DNA polymerase-3 subunit epsilon
VNKELLTYAAIDFETATSAHYSACAVAIINIKDGELVDKYYSLIQPPNNRYQWQTIRVHGIKPKDTAQAPTFDEVWPEIEKRLANRTIVAHNQGFDRSVLKSCIDFYNLKNNSVEVNKAWECTLKIYKALGYKPAGLSACCKVHNIPLDHHNALSDALACARLYYLSLNKRNK